MATEAERKAIAKYNAKFDTIRARIPKGQAEIYKKFAKKQGISLNKLIPKLLDEYIQTHSPELPDSQDVNQGDD